MDRRILAEAAVLDELRPSVLRGEMRPDLVKDEVLSEIFTVAAEAHAEKPALVGPGGPFTYVEVLERARAIGAALTARGIGAGHVVGLWMARGPALLVAQIGITMSGAAWLPFDTEAPGERIAECLADCGAKALLTGASLAERAKAAGSPVFVDASLIAEKAPALPKGRPSGLTPHHPAYVIYTSGSTGKPKGIIVTHHNICHFLRSANEVYGIRADDVVFQGASLAFDLSMEEIWIPYLVGATLFVADARLLGESDQLADVLEANRITVIDTVPTLLTMIGRDVASLRLILLGGEALPPALAARWAKPHRRVFNTYGPTEATVVATVDEVHPGEPITIGRPIPNYSCWIAGPDLSLVAQGQEGELLIGGPGITRGYLQRPELTQQKFIPNPFPSDGSDPVLYRSGDAVSLDAQGRILFHGRIDDQVKIRGFRVELGEIESRLAEEHGVAQAAVVLRQDAGVEKLVAFLVARTGASPAPRDLRVALARQLPAYMVPARFERVATLPRLASGKIDRGALKKLELAPQGASGEQDPPRNATEQALLEAARRALGAELVPLEADFFAELGGHSLIAARFVSFVRETPALARIRLQDVYEARTLRAIAARLDAQIPPESEPIDLSFAPPPLLRRFLCGLAQAAVMPVFLGLVTAQWLGVYIAYILLSPETGGFFEDLATVVTVYVAINVATFFIGIGGKWLVLGRAKPGRYPLWGLYYFRYWLAAQFGRLTPGALLQGSPVMNFHLRMMGAKVGQGAYIGEVICGAPDLVTIGPRASIGRITIANATVIGNEFVLGHVEIGEDAYIGSSCVIGHDVIIDEGAELADLTSISPGQHVGKGEIWDGSPGCKVGNVDAVALPAHAEASQSWRALTAAFHVLMLLAIPPLGLMPVLPAFYLFDQLADLAGSVSSINYLYLTPIVAWPTAMALIALTVLLIAAIRWIVLPRVRPGVHSIYSMFYWRMWLVGLCTAVTLGTLNSLYATFYMRWWYRLMGARIGRGAEISTSLGGRYDLVEIGENCFIADEVMLGEEDVRRGYMMLAPVKIAARTFVGNSAVVAPGTEIAKGALIGVKSKPPGKGVGENEIWFGSPPLKFPVRQTFDVGDNWTFEPSFARKLGRAVFEAFCVSLPTALYITLGVFAAEYLAPAVLDADFDALIPQFLAAGVLISVMMMLVVCALKWLLMGVYKPMMRPMWSWFALRSEAIAVAYSTMASRVLLDHLHGTPMLPWCMRLFGAKIGEGTYWATTDITEFDCIDVGDFCAINDNSALQTHLYEDRLMKIGRIKLGKGVTVGAGSTVLYDTRLEDHVRLGPLTVVMKGEGIPANSAWGGAPAQPAKLRCT
ncbi:MAG: amino acid adenylation domain-containing protein [Hyphomicrobiales bacterium]|nr:amino acid adenylation domain-containing protein [Hyphomicrobiales bacterium]